MDYLIPPDELRTDQFVLRRYEPDDGPRLYEAIQEAQQHPSEWLLWSRRHVDADHAAKRARQYCARWLMANDFLLAIVEPSGERFLGGCGYHLRGKPLGNLIAECGMWLRPTCHSKGLGTNVLRALIDWGFSDAWPWERIEWRCDERNIASWRTAEKAGMTLEGKHRHIRLEPEDDPRDSRVYAILRSEHARA